MAGETVVKAVLAEHTYSNGAFVRVELIDDAVDPIRLIVKSEDGEPRGYAMRPDEALKLSRLLLDALDRIVLGIEYTTEAE